MSEKTREEAEKERMLRRNYGDYLTDYPTFFGQEKQPEADDEETATPNEEESSKDNNFLSRILVVAILILAPILYHKLQKFFYYNLSDAIGFHSESIFIPLTIGMAVFVIQTVIVLLKNKFPALRALYEMTDDRIVYVTILFIAITVPITFFFRTELFPEKIVKYGFPNRIEKSLQITDAKTIELTVLKERHKSKSRTSYTYKLGLIFIFNNEAHDFYEFRNYDTIFNILKDYEGLVPIRTSNSQYLTHFLNAHGNKLSQKNYKRLKEYFKKSKS